MTTLHAIDLTAIAAGKVMTGTVLALAFVSDAPLLAVSIGLTNVWAASNPDRSPLRWFYRSALVPAGLTPRLAAESPAPHRFTQTASGALSAIGGTIVLAGWNIGWVIVLVVVCFSAISLAIGWCAGCATHRLLARLRATTPSDLVPLSPVVVFTSSQCPACQAQSRHLAQLRPGDRAGVSVIDITQDSRLADSWRVRSLPTTIRHDRGRPTAVHRGIIDARGLEAMIDGRV